MSKETQTQNQICHFDANRKKLFQENIHLWGAYKLEKPTYFCLLLFRDLPPPYKLQNLTFLSLLVFILSM